MATFPSYRYAIQRCRVLSKFNKIPVSWQWTKRFHFSFYFFPAIEGMKILITTKSHLVPLLSQQKRMKWSGTDFGWWMHSTYPKIKVDESLVEPKKCLCFVYSSSTTNEWIRFVLLLMHFQFYRSLWWNSWKLRRKSNERKFVYNAMRSQIEICSAKIQFQLRQHMLLCVFVFFSWLNHFSTTTTTTTTSLEIPTLDFGQYISVLDVRCILNLPQIPYTIYMCIWKPKICRPSQRCTLEIIELIWGKLIKLHSKHRNFLYFSF